MEDRLELKTQIHAEGNPASWIKMSGEQVDELIRLLQLQRGKLA
jgi:hypothetical protein